MNISKNGRRAALCAAFFAVLLIEQAHSQQDNQKQPNCKTQKVSEISDPLRANDFLIHVCGDDVVTELVKKNVETEEAQQAIDKQSKKGWQEASAWTNAYAQESIAHWTKWLVIVTTIGGAVALVALWYLRKTFKAAHRTALAAERADKPMLTAMMAEHHPPGSGRLRLDNSHMHSHDLGFDIINLGKSVGISSHIRAGGMNVPPEAPSEIPIDTWEYIDENFAQMHPPEGKDGTITVDFQLPEEHIPTNLSPRCYLAWLIIEYSDAASRRWRSTCVFRSLEPAGAGQIGFGPVSYSDEKIDN